MMKIGVLTSWLSHRSGGLREAVSRLVLSLQGDPECHITVFGLADWQAQAEDGRWGPRVTALPTRGPDLFGYAPRLSAALESADLDLLHVHGLWMHYSVASLRWIRTTGRPCIISPHGMLDPWALAHSGWKKRVALFAYERGHLESAACLHALCGAEAAAMRAIGLRNPICIIPNGLETPSPGAAEEAVWHGRIPADARILFYLGRLHPKKGLIPLLHAWQSFASGPGDNWHLVIAGWDQAGHERELRRLANELEIADRVHFSGPLFGAQKTAAYSAATAFVLPSLSEGVPMVVLESWSHGLPVLMTPQCNLPEGFASGAALEIGTDSRGIRDGLDRLARMSHEQLRRMGANGRRLCLGHFSQARNCERMRSIYRWLLNMGPRPDWVVDDIESASTPRDGKKVARVSARVMNPQASSGIIGRDFGVQE